MFSEAIFYLAKEGFSRISRKITLKGNGALAYQSVK